MGFDNSGHIIGNLTHDPEVRVTESGMTVTNLRLAWNKRMTDGDDVPNYFNVVCFRSLAENVGESFSKGDRVTITYTLQQRSYQSNKFKDENGQPATIQAVELIADDVAAATKFATVSITRNPKASNGQAEAQAAAAGVAPPADAPEPALVPDTEPF